MIEDFGFMLSVEDIGKILGVSRPTVDKMIESGELPVARVGNRPRVSAFDFVVWWDARVLAQQKEMLKGYLRK